MQLNAIKSGDRKLNLDWVWKQGNQDQNVDIEHASDSVSEVE